MIGCREWEVRDCCLKSYGFFYISNVWWDLMVLIGPVVV